MADEPAPLQLLARALDQAGQLVAGTGPDQSALPTPCRSWSVHQLVAHLVRDVGNFATAAGGGQPDYSRPLADLSEDWSADLAAARGELDRAWSAADLESNVPGMGGAEVPLVSRADQQIAELAVHSWDLARATAQGEDLDPAVAEHGLRWGKRNLAPQFRGAEGEGKAFGEEVIVPDDAPPYERLAGWFGRDPRWAP
jgi:uncharacterized protein (TIGR03086 family)